MYKNYPKSSVRVGHPDFAELKPIFDALVCADTTSPITEQFSELCRVAVDYVLDPIRTGRTTIHELDKNEKSFIGLKIEHAIIDHFGFPRGVKYDMRVGEAEVDIKNSIATGWAIPRETYTYEGVCLIAAFDESKWKSWLGLMKCRDEYLGKKNQDAKRGIPVSSFEHVMWLAEGVPLAPSKWDEVDVKLLRKLRAVVKTGNERARLFFESHTNIKLHRDVVHALLYDQLDYMKRIRGNGGARDLLGPAGIAIVSGHWLSERELMNEFGLARVTKLHIAALEPRNLNEADLLKGAHLKRYRDNWPRRS